MTMFRLSNLTRATVSLLLLLMLLVPTGALRAADPPPPGYTVSVDAMRTGEQLTLAIEVAKARDDGGIEPLAAPRLIVERGKRATVSVGSERPAGPLPPPPTSRTGPGEKATEETATTLGVPAPEDLESGLRVDVISVKGKDHVIVVSTVVQNGATTWAESKTIDVTVKPRDGQK